MYYKQPPITCNAIQIFLLAAHSALFKHPPSAVSSVCQLSLKILLGSLSQRPKINCPGQHYLQSAKTYQMTSQDMNLHNALHKFCKEKTIEKFGRACLRDTGLGIIMANDVLFRILHCAHFNVIETTEQLAKETQGDQFQDVG